MSHYSDYYDLSRIRPEVAVVLDKINEMGPTLRERAVGIDADASFPTENYQDFAKLGYLTLTVPEEFGGHGFSLRPKQYPLSTWPDLCLEWLRDKKILQD